MLPAIYQDMQQRGWPACPYVNPVQDSPDAGIEHSLEVPRFSTGYAALHHTLGFMTETHMLKPFADRYAAMRALVETVLAFTVNHAVQIQSLRRQAKDAAAQKTRWPVQWRIDHSQPWEKDIAVFDRCVEEVVIDTPSAYLIPQAWREVIERLQWNKVQLQRLASDQSFAARSYRIEGFTARAQPYEGHLFHEQVTLSSHTETVHARAGDCLVHLNQANARYAVETLEPQAHDSFFRWGFFNSVLEKKENFSDYVFEDTALDMLRDEPELKAKFERWKAQHPELLSDQKAVLGFIFANGQRFHEPSWMRYPIASLFFPEER